MEPGDLLKKQRLELGLSQAQLGEKIGLSQQQIDRLEEGTRMISAKWALLLGDELNLDPLELVDKHVRLIAERAHNLTPSEKAQLELVRSLNPVQQEAFDKAVAAFAELVTRTG